MDSHKEEQEKVIEADDEDGGWVDTHHFPGKCSVVDNSLAFHLGGYRVRSQWLAVVVSERIL